MRTITKQDRADATALALVGHPIAETTLNRRRLDERLGPLTDDQSRRVEHHIAADELLGRGRSASWATQVMAGRGFPTDAWIDLLRSREGLNLKEWEARRAAPPDEHPERERVAQVEDATWNALEQVKVDPVFRVFAPIMDQMGGNISARGRDPVGQQSIGLEEVGRRIEGLSPDPAGPDTLLATWPTGAGPTQQEAKISSAILNLGPALIDEICRVVRERPPQEIADVAVALTTGGAFGDPDDEQTAARAAMLAPAFLAVRNLIAPTLTASGRKRRLPEPD